LFSVKAALISIYEEIFDKKYGKNQRRGYLLSRVCGGKIDGRR